MPGMTFTPDPVELAIAIDRQRDDADLIAQVLRTCLHIGVGIGRALEAHAVILTTERTASGGMPRGADLSASFDRLSRAMRRTAALLTKTNAEIVALCYAPQPVAPPPPEPAPPNAARPATPDRPAKSAPPTTEHHDPERHDPERPDTDHAEASHETNKGDPAEHLDDEDPAETIPDHPIAELIEAIKRDLALADPRHHVAPVPSPAPIAEPCAQPSPWAYERPPPEPPIPGILTLDDLRRIPTGPSG